MADVRIDSLNGQASFLFSVRFLLAIIGSLAYASQYSQNIDISIAILCMVNNTAIDSIRTNNNKSFVHPQINLDNDEKCSVLNSTEKLIDGSFLWDKPKQGIILSAYFFGYFLTQIPGAYLSLKFGTKKVLACSVLGFSLLTLSIPFASNYGYLVVALIRFLTGAFQGPIWPSFSGFWARWSPPNERSRLIAISNSGCQIGTIITLPLTAYLCEHGFAGGWPSIFYILGTVGVIWTILWIIFASDSPETNHFISNKERDYILKSTNIDLNNSNKKIPWLKIFKSRTCIALFIGHMSSDWGVFLFLTSLPTYMKEVLKFDISSNGLLSAVPYVFFWLFQMLSAVSADFLIKNCNLSIKTVRITYNIIGFIVPMIAIICLGFISCTNKYYAVFLVTTGLAFSACTYGAGFLVSYNDIAGVYSGIVFSIANTLGTIPGFIAPYAVSLLTKNKTKEEWQIVFYITAGIYLLGCAFLVLFPSGNSTKSWAVENKIPNNEEIPLNT